MPVAGIDACVLYRGTITDFLLNAADVGLFEPVWSDAIANEWVRNLGERTNIPKERIDYRRSEMDRAFPGARCRADPKMLERVQDLCRSPAEVKDAHVIATAAAARASLIVTNNLGDFPSHVTSPFGLRVISPDAFYCELAAAHPRGALTAARLHYGSLRRPPLSVHEYLALLSSPKAELHQSKAWLAANGFAD
jgi:hypothetical protein